MSGRARTQSSSGRKRETDSTTGLGLDQPVLSVLKPFPLGRKRKQYLALVEQIADLEVLRALHVITNSFHFPTILCVGTTLIFHFTDGETEAQGGYCRTACEGHSQDSNAGCLQELQ